MDRPTVQKSDTKSDAESDVLSVRTSRRRATQNKTANPILQFAKLGCAGPFLEAELMDG